MNLTQFYEELDELIQNDVSLWPEDKQKHFRASNGLTNTAWPQNLTFAGMSLEIIFRVLLIGLAKELGDKGIPTSKYDVLIDSICQSINQLDGNMLTDGLDQGDINADLLGILFGVFKNLRANAMLKPQ